MPGARTAKVPIVGRFTGSLCLLLVVALLAMIGRGWTVGAGRGAPAGGKGAQAGTDRNPLDQDVALVPYAHVAPGVHQLETHLSAVYVIETSVGLVLVDAGLTEGHGALLRQMSRLKLDSKEVRAVLLTHAHGDHSLGAMAFKRTSGATIYAGRDDASVLRDGGPREAYFSVSEMPQSEIHATDVDVELRGGEMLTFGDTRIEVLATPGHTPGSTCYLLERGGWRIFFGGDTVMNGLELGTYAAYKAPRYRGDARTYLKTLWALSALPVPDILLPGHPRRGEIPQAMHVVPARWSSMFEHGIHELQELVEHHEKDGADFLDGQPKELLPGLHYLGDTEGSAVYLLATPKQLLLFDAPGGHDFPEWLDSRLRTLALESRPLTAVLLTSCGHEATSGLPALVEKTNCRVVTSESGVAALRDLGLPDSRLLSAGALAAAGWIDVTTLALADVRPGAMGYVIPWCGRTVLVSGRVPLEENTAGLAALQRVLDGEPERIEEFEETFRRLLQVNPDLWLPAEPLQGRNANWYSYEWRKMVSSAIPKLRTGRREEEEEVEKQL